MTCQLEDDMNVKTLPENHDRNDDSLDIHAQIKPENTHLQPIFYAQIF
jgi:hypothetical protein